MYPKYFVKSGLTNVLKNANKTKNMHLFLNLDCQLKDNHSYHVAVCLIVSLTV